MRTLRVVDFDTYDRNRSIGGSEVACVIDQHPYKSKYRLWAEKVGLMPWEDLQAKDAVYFGHEFEDIILRRWCEKHRIDPEAILKPGTFIDDRNPWISASPDGVHVGGEFGIEIKFVGYRQLGRWGREGTADIPPEYLCQCAWYAMALEVPQWNIVSLVGTEMREHIYYRNRDFERALFNSAEAFWHRHVLANDAPAPDGSKSSAEILKLLAVKVEHAMRSASVEERKTIAKYVIAKAAAKESAAEAEVLKQHLQQAIGSGLGLLAGSVSVEWKPNINGVRSFIIKETK